MKYFFTKKLSTSPTKQQSDYKAFKANQHKIKMINQRLSLVIPRVFPQWVDEEKIIKIFQDQQLGIISKVRIVRIPDEKGRSYPIYKAYLYFSVWFDNIIVKNFQYRIYNKEKQARVVYDDPWFWTVFENTSRVKLSKIDKRIMRLTAEIYKTSQIVKTQQEELANELDNQNKTIQLLQDFCFKNGLEIPFWSASNPPSAEISSVEGLTAATAVASANFVLDGEDDDNICYEVKQYNKEESQMEHYSIPYEPISYEPISYEPISYEPISYEPISYDSVFVNHPPYSESYGWPDANAHANAEANEYFNYDFIPIKSYKDDWINENPYTNNTPQQSNMCSYLGDTF